MRGKWILIGGVALIAGIGAVTLALIHRGTPPPPAATRPAATEAPPSEANLPGKLRAQHLVGVDANVDGVIESMDFDVGADVHEGDVLARIGAQGLEAERQHAQEAVEAGRSRLNSLEAAVTAARLEASRARADAGRARSEADRTQKVYQRQQLLHREGATPRLTFERSQADYENAQTEFDSLDALARQADERASELVKNLDLERRILNDKARQLDDAQTRLAEAQIHSPVDGIVVARHGEPGRPVDPENRTLFQIAVDTNLLEAVLEPEPPLLARIRAGQPALIVSADIPGDGIPGQVKVVENNQVVVEFVSPTPALRPGAIVQVRVKLL